MKCTSHWTLSEVGECGLILMFLGAPFGAKRRNNKDCKKGKLKKLAHARSNKIINVISVILMVKRFKSHHIILLYYIILHYITLYYIILHYITYSNLLNIVYESAVIIIRLGTLEYYKIVKINLNLLSKP